MANANAIKIRSTKKKANGKPKYPKPSGANLAHNSAVNKATYWLNDGNKIIQSQSYNNTHEVNADWIKWENEARERYLQNEKNQRAIKSNAVLLEEGLIIIGTDVNAKEKDIEKIVKDFVAKFEKDNNTKVRHWAYHNHEGHEEDGKEHINRHVHFIFDNVDNNGTMVRRNWKRDYFKQMQTDIFDISKKYIKNIERAKESEYEEVEIEDRIVKVNTRKQIHHRVFRQMKENEQVQELNLKFTDMMKERDTFKKETSSLKGQNTKLKNTQNKLKDEIQEVNSQCESLKFDKKELEKQLKELNNLFRADLKESGATREQYAELEALVKELKEELKNKTLTVESMNTKFAELEKKLLKEKEHLISLIEVKEIDILNLNNQNKALISQKQVLEEKVTTLEQKEAPEPNIVGQKEINDELQKIIQEEFIKKDLFESRISKASPVITVKDSRSFLKRVQELATQGVQSVANTVNSLKKEINEWREKYNSLVEILKSKDQKIADLEDKLRTISSKQQKEESKDQLDELVEQFDAHKGDESDSSILLNKKEVQEEEEEEEITPKTAKKRRSR
jgi:chromosome segregation ATPase